MLKFIYVQQTNGGLTMQVKIKTNGKTVQVEMSEKQLKRVGIDRGTKPNRL